MLRISPTGFDPGTAPLGEDFGRQEEVELEIREVLGEYQLREVISGGEGEYKLEMHDDGAEIYFRDDVPEDVVRESMEEAMKRVSKLIGPHTTYNPS